jgi:hypothetical protein
LTRAARRQCRVAGQALRPAQPPQNRTCRFSRIRLKHQPAHTRSTAGTVRDGTSGGRERGSYLRSRGRGAPRCWCCRPAQGQDQRPLCRPRTPELGVPWRIRDSPQIQQMICYSNLLKSKKENVRPQFLSVRQHGLCGQSLRLLIGPEKLRNSAVFRGWLCTLDWRRRLGITL